MSSRHLRAGAVALLALLAFACGSSTPTITDVARAALTVTVQPTPVPPTQDVLTGSCSVSYKITLTETAGLGGTVQFVSSQIFDPATGQLLSLTYFDSDDLTVFVGKNRIDPGGTLVVPQTGTYILPDLSKNATLVVSAQMKDDRDNLINQSVMVKVE